jgi:hypothetical protein
MLPRGGRLCFAWGRAWRVSRRGCDCLRFGRPIDLPAFATRRAVSSAVEHCFHTAGATGSIPVPPTSKIKDLGANGSDFSGTIWKRIWNYLPADTPIRPDTRIHTSPPRGRRIRPPAPASLGSHQWSNHVTEPLSLDTILNEFTEESTAWVLQARNGQYLVVPDPRHPGRRPVRFFMSRADAERVLANALRANPALVAHQLSPSSVKLLTSLRGIAADQTPGNADSFVIHSPNEIHEFDNTGGFLAV